MQSVPVLVSHFSSRLQYVLDWLSGQLGISLRCAENATEVAGGNFFIAYGNNTSGALLHIPDEGLLREYKQLQQTSYVFPENAAAITDITTFDLFSAIFFLLSRYEEYLPFTPDKHGRYPAAESVLYKQGILEIPVVDQWVQQLRILLKEKYHLPVSQPAFSYLPTYDIDIAWSYKNKGLVRNTGALAADVLKGKFSGAAERIQVLNGVKKDPYDAFEHLSVLHKKFHVKPLYFILFSLRTTAFDKNISPENPAMQQLIRKLSAEGTVAMHPSYYSDTAAVFSSEKKMLEATAGKQVTLSRQHYIKLKLPDTYSLLMQHNIYEDYSMGYGTHLGFRAGTGSSFLWYDLQQEQVTKMKIFPFCFMDTTAHYDQGLSCHAAFDRLKKMAWLLKESGSMLITVFHNFSQGTSDEWKGWAEAYEKFLQKFSAAIF
ncbi:DUF7033 domain-containing protein [Chitinophagaceae bacterium MMS25-I14]